MRKRVRIALAVLFVAVVSGIVWQVLQPREPVYQGKPLSFWLIYGKPQESEDAVRQAGTNAIPTLLRMLRAKDSALKVKLMDLTSRQHIIKIHFTQALVLNIEAVHGFAALGAKAQSAVPAVIEILNQDGSSYHSMYALSTIGPAAKEAIPALLKRLDDPTTEYEYAVFSTLRGIGAKSDEVVPVLIRQLASTNVAKQGRALARLSQFGSDAKSAVPKVLGFLDSPQLSLRWEATNCLKTIDPEAAAKAGVK